MKKWSNEQFLDHLLKTKDEPSDIQRGLVVQGTVGVDYKTCPMKHIWFQDITFMDQVSIQNFPKECSTLHFQSCHFTQGLGLEGNKAKSIIIQECTAQWIHVYRCEGERAFLDKLEVNRSIDISGLTLTEFLDIDDIKRGEIEIIQRSTHGYIKAPLVKTDDPLIALQFRMAGIPVFMSSEAVRSMAAGLSN